MKVGSLVKYKDWFTGPPRSGLVVEHVPHEKLVFVIWSRGDAEWEFCNDLVLLKRGENG